MNSLSTTVGGEVINEDDINISSSSSRQRTKKPPLLLRGSTTGGHRVVRRNQMKSIVDTKNNDISPRVGATRSNLPRASLNRHRSAPVSNNNASSNFGSSNRIMRRNRGLSISEKSNTEESVDDVNSRLRSSLLQSMSNLSSRSTATPPFDNRNYTPAAVVVDNEDEEVVIDEQFDEVYKSTSDEDTNNIANNHPRVVTPRSSSPPHNNNSNNKQSILSQLNKISKLEPYNSSPYFQKIFTNGKVKVQKYYSTRQDDNTEDLNDIEHALRKCFDINEDMISVIANSTVTSTDDVQKKERIMMDEYLSDKLFDGDSQDSPPEQDTHKKKLKPWETPTSTTPRSSGRGGGLSTTPRRLDRSSGRYQSQFTTPTDLSGYRNNKNNKMSTASFAPLQDTPKHALTLPLPPTPRTPGKQHTPTRSPEDNEHVVTIVVPSDKKKLYLPSPSEASSSSPASPTAKEDTNHNHNKKVSTKYLVDTSLKSIPRNRQQQSRVRIQEYLSKVDDRIKNVKSAATVGVSSSTTSRRPDIINKRVQSSSVVMDRRRLTDEAEHHVPPRPWDSFDNMSPAMKRGMKKQLFLPSLMSPDNGATVVDAESGIDRRSKFSVFRANAAVQEQQEQQESEMKLNSEKVIEEVLASDLPLDEAADIANQRNVQLIMPPYVSLQQTGLSTMTTFNTPIAAHTTDTTVSEQQIKEYEHSVGLFSIQDYKHLLKEKTVEIANLEHRYKAHIEASETNMAAKDADISQFRVAMKEAEHAVKALEETIQKLEQASKDKDELIAMLQARVKELEAELEQSTAKMLEKEIEHQEGVKTLNESIAQACGEVKDKEASIAELEAKTAELGMTLDKTKEQRTVFQTELANAQKNSIEKDERLKTTQDELASTKDLLQGQMTLYKNEISSSLSNTTQLMERMSKEKDSLIHSLNAKIEMLEQSLTESNYDKDMGAVKHEENEKELNEKIHNLAMALTDKDKIIAELQKETHDVKVKSSAQAKKLTSLKKKKSEGRRGRRKSERDRYRHGRSSSRSRYHRRSRSRSEKKKHRHHHRRSLPQPEYEPPTDSSPTRYGSYAESRDDDDRSRLHHLAFVTNSQDSIFDFQSGGD